PRIELAKGPSADHLLRPRAVPGAEARFRELPDLLLGDIEASHRGGASEAEANAGREGAEGEAHIGANRGGAHRRGRGEEEEGFTAEDAGDAGERKKSSPRRTQGTQGTQGRRRALDGTELHRRGAMDSTRS